MSSEATETETVEKSETRQLLESMSPEKRKALIKGANATLMVSLTLTLLWLYAYNLIVHHMNPLLAFFKVLDGINDLVTGMLGVVAIGVGVIIIWTATVLFTQTITNLYSMRIMEDLIRDFAMKGKWKEFIRGLIYFDEIPKPVTPFPRHTSSAILVFTYHYVVAWFYLVVFTECLYFAAWSAGVYLDLYPSTMHIMPMFAIAVPFTARLMAYLKYPYAEDYAGFIPGILFVVVLLLAFVGMMGGNFQYFFQDAAGRSEVGYFAQGALFWKFLKDGCLIAFYPVFGEVIFFYLQYQELKRADDAIEDDLMAAELAAEAAGETVPAE
ncbi:MAG: hypothetical protein KDA24_14650 [Deltaproteobacteria bacterium]|nr:hypothetical protein [Deltaproteobacteria bacterium]